MYSGARYSRVASVLFAVFTAIILILGLVQPSIAETMSERQVQIIAKTLKFLKTDRVYEQRVVILQGAADIEIVNELFPNSIVEECQSASDIGQASVVFAESFQQAQATSPQAIIVSNDIDCVEQSQCTLGVATDPRVQIFLSREAAARAGAEFDPSLVMLLTLK